MVPVASRQARMEDLDFALQIASEAAAEVAGKIGDHQLM